MALSYSKTGRGWARSCRLGERIAVVLLCEVIDHPDVKIKSQGEKKIYFFGLLDERCRPHKLL